MLDPARAALVLARGRRRRSRAATARPTSPACPAWTPTGSTPPPYMHTSGTTGLPKFCAQTHELLPAPRPARSPTALDLTPADRVLAPLPLFHINPLGYGIIGALTAGADALTVRKFSASGFWPTVRRARHHGARPARPAGRDPQAGHHRRRRRRPPACARCSTPTESSCRRFGIPARGVRLRLHRGRPASATCTSGASATTSPPTPAGTAAPTRVDVQAPRRRRADPRPGTRARHPVRRLLHRRHARPGPRRGRLVRHRRPRSCATRPVACVFLERAAESIRVKGEFVPIPFVEEHLRRHRRPRRPRAVEEARRARRRRGRAVRGRRRGLPGWTPPVAVAELPGVHAPRRRRPGPRASRATPPRARSSAGCCRPSRS